MEHIALGPVPCEEECVQTTDPNYGIKAFRECAVYRDQLIRTFEAEHGRKPKCRIHVHCERGHDFGDYYEVCASFREDDNDAAQDAFALDGSTPAKWDTVAKSYLALC